MEALTTAPKGTSALLSLKTLYTSIRQATEAICTKLQPEDYVAQPVAWVSPPKWHLAHTTWFFENFILKEAIPGYKIFDKDFHFLFNSYYETAGRHLGRDQRGALSRPSVDAVYAYRRHVDEAIVQLLSHPIDEKFEKTIQLGLQHEQQHQELLVTDTKFIFSQNPLLPVWDEEKTLDHLRQAEDLQWLEVPEGVYEIGFYGEGFCFDNELQLHKQFIHSIDIRSQVVTNGEYLEFINDGGYQNVRYWLSEGWEWLHTDRIEHPMYWYKQDGERYFYHLDGLKKLDLSLPLMHISYYEADAFARWKGLRLPTEFEWETAARLFPSFFTNMVWEWTKSAYSSYPGFATDEGTIGEYNGKFMVNQMVLRGGSIATPEGHSRVSYRNFFHPQMQWQFSGLRLAKDKKEFSF